MTGTSAKGIFRELLWPGGVLGKLGRLSAVLSVVALIKYALDFGVARTLVILIEWYDRFVKAALSWLKPLATSVAELIAAWLALPLNLHEHWNHVFVLLWVYFFRDGATKYSYGYRSAGVFAMVWGALVAFATAIATGLIPIKDSGAQNQYFMAVAPVFGVLAYEIPKQLWDATFTRDRVARIYQTEVMSWWDYARPNLFLNAFQFFGGFTIGVLFVFTAQSNIRSPGLAAVAVLLVLVALYRAGVAASEVRELRREGDSWLFTFNRTSGAGVAVSVIGLLLWILIFLTTNAGLQFYGL